MIANQYLSKEWINRKRGEMGSVDPALLEKSIHAFALLCALSESSLPSLRLKPPLENLNRIKALIPEAFYNLYTAQELLK